MQNTQEVRQIPRWVVIGAILLFAALNVWRISGLIDMRIPSVHGDFENYTIAIMQTENPDLFSRDPMWQNGHLAESFWASSFVYMSINQFFFNINGTDYGHTLLALNGLWFFLLSIGLYLLFYSIRKHRLSALVMALAATMIVPYSVFYVPTGLHLVLSSIYMLGIYHWLVVPGLEGRPPPIPRLIALGVVIGISPALISSVHGLSLILWLGVITLAQLLLRHLPLRAFIAFWAAVIPPFLIGVMLGTGGANPISDESAQWLVSTVRFPAVSFLPIFIVLGLIAVITGVMALRRGTKRLKIAFYVVNLVIWLIAGVPSGFGWWPVTWYFALILLAPITIYRINKGQDEKIDYALTIGLTAPLISGPLALETINLIWRITGWNELIGIMWQMFRFPQVSFIPAGIALYLIIYRLLQVVPNDWRRVSLLVAFGLIITFNTDLYFNSLRAYEIGGPPTYYFLLMLVVVAFFMMRSNAGDSTVKSQADALTLSLAGVAVLAVAFYLLPVEMAIIVIGALLVAVVWPVRMTRLNFGFAVFAALLIGYSVMQTITTLEYDEEEIAQIIAEDVSWDEALGWIEVNTAPDALFHFPHRWTNERIRSTAQRNLLTNWMDAYNTPYARLEPIDLHNIRDDSEQSDTPEESVAFAVRYDVDYLVTEADFGQPLPAVVDGVTYTARNVYENAHYVIYRISA
ncbi:MAG: hypothetical protein EA396_14075, partial [Anaerolineaceae bacterium]